MERRIRGTRKGEGKQKGEKVGEQEAKPALVSEC